MRSTLMWRGGVWVRYVGAGRRAAVVIRQAGLAATASVTPVPSTPYGPTSRISRSEADSLEAAVIDVSFRAVLSSSEGAILPSDAQTALRRSLRLHRPAWDKRPGTL